MKLIKLVMLALCVSIFAACTTVEKFTVTGTPGTKVYSPEKVELATIGSNGKTKIQVPSNAFYGYLYTHDEALDLWVPFGLDTKEKSHIGANLAIGAEYMGTIAGLAATVVGIVIISGDSESPAGAALISGGLGLSTISGISGAVTSGRMQQLSYQYCFTYQKNQSTNTDLSLMNYTAPVVAPTESALSRLRAGNPSSKMNQQSSSQPVQHAQRSKIQLKSKAEKVRGEYSGQATLSQGKVTVETFDAVTVIIIPVDENNVTVDVLSENESFFDEPLKFKVRSISPGNYSLTCRNQPNAVITIKDGVLNITHPAINLGGDLYKLTVRANK